jgi:biopolymer transport protein ExbD
MQEDHTQPPPIPTVRQGHSIWLLVGCCAATAVVSAMIAALVFNGFQKRLERHEREFDMMVHLPDAKQKRAALGRPTKLIVINVRAEDRAADEALYVVSGSRVNLLQLRKIVRDSVEANMDQKVLIRGDKLALHANVANAVAACHDGGVTEANIGYDYKPAE